AIAGGIATNLFGERRQPAGVPPPAPMPVTALSEERAREAESRHVPTIAARARRVVHYAFGELLDEIAHWLVMGIVVAALITVLVPPSLIEHYLGGGLVTMLIMLVIAIPVYTCASASTPIAAALILKGLDPGAALVFLLAGPAAGGAGGNGAAPPAAPGPGPASRSPPGGRGPGAAWWPGPSPAAPASPRLAWAGPRPGAAWAGSWAGRWGPGPMRGSRAGSGP